MRRILATALGLVSVTTAAGAPTAPALAAAACSGCHPAGTGLNSPVPRLAGLDEDIIIRAMSDFRSGQRAATVMDRIAKGFTDEEIQAIAAWYARQR